MLTTLVNVLQSVLMHLNVMLILILLIKLDKLTAILIQIFGNKNQIYVKNSISNISDPCGIPV